MNGEKFLLQCLEFGICRLTVNVVFLVAYWGYYENEIKGTFDGLYCINNNKN